VIATTSRDAYDEHLESGKLGEQQRKLMLWFHTHGGRYTRAEIASTTGMRLSSVCGRVNELIQLGYLEEGDRRKCIVTGRSAHPVGIRRPREQKQLTLLEEAL
jgi:DNA-binding IclR family transcriptional regulator